MNLPPLLSRSFSFSLSLFLSGGGGGGACCCCGWGVLLSFSPVRNVSDAGSGSSFAVPLVFTSRQETEIYVKFLIFYSFQHLIHHKKGIKI